MANQREEDKRKESRLADPERKRRLLLRLMEALREVGVLFFAFAPLDASLSKGGVLGNLGAVVVFLLLGCAFFALGAIGEVLIE